MCLLATAGRCTCHYFRRHHSFLPSMQLGLAHSPSLSLSLRVPYHVCFSQCFSFSTIKGELSVFRKKRGSPLILDWLDWAWRPKGSNPHPLKTRDANSNHNTANICFALPKHWFETCLEQSSRAAAFSAAPAAKGHSFLWHVLWVLARHVYIYRDRVMTHVHGLLVLS